MDGEIEPEHRGDTRVTTGQDEADGSVEPVAVGQGEGVLAQGGSACHQRRRAAGAMAQGVAGGDVEVDEGVGGHGFAAGIL